ncbi:DMT family transporter [Acetobacter nitrogenifigens]|nr:DMT family transporter [Acetobacter nitrogenifigens]
MNRETSRATAVSSRAATGGEMGHQVGQNWITLGFLSILWGGSFFFYKVLAPSLPPLTLVFGRVGFAAVALLAVLVVGRREFPLGASKIGWFLVLGAFNCAIPFSLYAWSERFVTSGVAATLNATTPIFTGIAMHLSSRDDRLTRRKIVGIACAFCGVAVLIGRDLLSGLSLSVLPGELACLGATTSYAIGAVLTRKLHGVAPLQLTTGQLAGAALVILPLALLHDGLSAWRGLGAETWAAWLGIALLSTALAYLIFFRILTVHGANQAVLVTFLVPVSALAMGALLLGETLKWNTLAGAVLIGCGLAVIDGRLLRRLWRREVPCPG